MVSQYITNSTAEGSENNLDLSDLKHTANAGKYNLKENYIIQLVIFVNNIIEIFNNFLKINQKYPLSSVRTSASAQLNLETALNNYQVSFQDLFLKLNQSHQNASEGSETMSKVISEMFSLEQMLHLPGPANARKCINLNKELMGQLTNAVAQRDRRMLKSSIKRAGEIGLKRDEVCIKVDIYIYI